MRRFRSLLSGVSAVAVMAALGSAGPALAAATFSGPLTSPPIVNDQPDSYTINLDATVDKDGNGDSFFNGKAMSAATANLTVDDSYLLGNINNTTFMTSTGGNAIDILNDSQVDGAILNSGTITGATAGIAITDDSTVAGGITNNGAIIGGTTGILLGDDSEIFGGITNNGLITGVFGINVNDAEAELHGGITNSKNASIIGTSNAAIQFSGTALTGGITNDGLIQGQGSADGIRITAGVISGGITNNASGIIEVTGSQTALLLIGGTFNGDITNSGQILANAATGIAVHIAGATVFTGSIVNNSGGLISASSTALLIDNATFTGNVSNSGSIVSLTNDAVVVSATAFTGDFINESSGVIVGAGSGVYMNGPAFTGNLTNNGAIQGQTAGVFIGTTAFGGNVANAGLIEATGVAGNGLVVDVGTTLSGSITNSATGEITAANVGILIDGIVTGTVANDGLIDPATGISVTGQVGAITNSGRILATANAISLVGADTATQITQTGGLIQGNNGVAVTNALNLDQSGAEFVDTFNANGGTLDGNIVGGGADDVIMGPSGTFAYLRGTTSGLDQFDMTGSGTALLGANARGATGAVNAPGVTINAVSMTHGGEGTLYVDDDTIATLTGAYTQTNGTLEFQLTSSTLPADYGHINAATANLGGRIAAYVQGNTFGAVGGNTFTYANVITGTTGGTFTNAGAIDTNSLFFEGQAFVAANHVDIVLMRQSFADALVLPGLSHNEMAVGGTLDTIYNNGGYGTDFTNLYDYLLSLPLGSEGIVTGIYDNLAGAEHADIQEVGLRTSEAFADMIGERMDDMRSASHNASMASLGLRRYAEGAATIATDASGPPAATMPRNSIGTAIWARGFGAWTQADGDIEAAGYDQNTGGAAGGVDFAVDQNWRLGGAAGWSSTSVDFDTPGDKADVDSFQIAAYGSYDTGRFYLDASGGVGFHDISTTRLLELGFDSFVAVANYNATTWALNGEAGAVFDAGRIDIQPFVGIGYTSSSTDGFSESGAGAFSLLVGNADAESLASKVGLRFSGVWTAGGVRLIPDAEIAWRHEFMDERQAFSGAFLEDPATQFHIVSSALSRDSAVVGAGLGAQVTRGLVLFVDYNGVLNSTADTHAASAGFRANW